MGAKTLFLALYNMCTAPDLPLSSARQISELFTSLRPDIAIQKKSTIDILELTVCHETIAVSSRTFKQTKYKNIESELQRWGLESLDSDSSRTRVPILLDSDSDSSPSHLDSDSDSRHADSDSTRTRTVGTRPDSANCTDKNRFQAT